MCLLDSNPMSVPNQTAHFHPLVKLAASLRHKSADSGFFKALWW